MIIILIIILIIPEDDRESLKEGCEEQEHGGQEDRHPGEVQHWTTPSVGILQAGEVIVFSLYFNLNV